MKYICLLDGVTYRGTFNIQIRRCSHAHANDNDIGSFVIGQTIHDWTLTSDKMFISINQNVKSTLDSHCQNKQYMVEWWDYMEDMHIFGTRLQYTHTNRPLCFHSVCFHSLYGGDFWNRVHYWVVCMVCCPIIHAYWPIKNDITSQTW